MTTPVDVPELEPTPVPVAPTPPKPNRRRWKLIVLLSVVAALIAASGVVAWTSGIGRPAPTFLVHGTLTMDVPRIVDACELGRGYDDIRTGAAVTITDPSGTTVGVGRLGPNIELHRGSEIFWYCVFVFEVPDVPAGLRFYGIEVAHRGRVQFAEAAVRGTVELSLG